MLKNREIGIPDAVQPVGQAFLAWLLWPFQWSVIKIDGQRAADALLERDERLGSGNTINVLDAVIDQRHEVLIVASIDFYHHGEMTCSKVALDDFLDFQEFRDYRAVHGSPLQREPDECASGITQQLGVDVVARACNDPIVDEALDALVDCSPGYTAHLRNILAGDASVVHDNFQYLLV